MEKGTTLTGKQAEVLLGYLQDYKTYLEENCAENSDDYVSLLPFIDQIKKGAH